MNDAPGVAGILMFLMFIGTASCLMMLVKVGLVDQTMEAANALLIILTYVLASGLVLSSRNVLLVVLWTGLSLAATYGLTKLAGTADRETMTRLRAEDVERLNRVLANNPANVNARRELGDIYMDCGMYDEAIHQFKEAIRANPPEAPVYRRRLTDALDLRAGRSIETLICDNCGQETPVTNEICVHCGVKVEPATLSWLLTPENRQNIVRHSAIPLLAVVLLLTVTSEQEAGVKSVILIIAAALGGFYVLRFSQR